MCGKTAAVRAQQMRQTAHRKQAADAREACREYAADVSGSMPEKG
jgi:hypothetical protein